MGDVHFNPMDPEFIADPYPTYHRLRAEDPVHHSPLGFWVLTRYEDVVAALRDPRLVKEPIAAFVAARFGAAMPAMGLSMLDRDPPDHTRLRGLVNKAFTPRVVEGLRPHIQKIVDGLLARVEGAGTMELIEAFAYPLPVTGHETTVNLIRNGTLALLRHPDQLRRLREDPGLIGSAVEELLRYDGPVQRTARIPSADVRFDGLTIGKGEMVMPFIGAADRDPAQFPDPDRLDITRTDNRHIAFGWGIHFCLGAPLARVEGQIAIGTLVQRLPKLALATDRPEYRQSLTLRGLTTLPVGF